MPTPNLSPSSQQAEDQSSFGHKLGENHGQQGTPLGGAISVEDERFENQSRLNDSQDNPISGQKKPGHNSGSRAGQSKPEKKTDRI
jgi:hypothetical protein